MKTRTTLIFFVILLVSCTTNNNGTAADLQIHDIQGCSHLSPYVGKNVEKISGVVTHKVMNGFIMQSNKMDEKNCSSEGIFVFTKDYPQVMVGDLVNVNGRIAEFASGKSEDYNLTQTEIIDPEVHVVETNQPLPDPIILDEVAGIIPQKTIENDGMSTFDIEEDGLDFYESLESMLVEVQNVVVVGPKNEYNEIVIIPDALIEFNNISDSGAILNSMNDQNPERIMIKLPSDFDELINAGDQPEKSIIGIMDYSYGNYKILSLNPLTFTQARKNSVTFNSFSNGLTVATYNLENLSLFDEEKKFFTIARQIVNELSSPDLLVLHEIMDDSGTADDGVVKANITIEKLIREISAQGGPEYVYSDAPPENDKDGGIEGGNIRSVLLYRQDQGLALEPVDRSVHDVDFKNDKFIVQENPLRIGENSVSFKDSRKPAVWLLSQNGKQLFVFGVHLISQGTNSPDWGNKQPPLRQADQQRIAQAKEIQEFASELIGLKNEVPLFIAGDMNDVPWSKTLKTMMENNLMNAGEQDAVNEQYSYIFEGSAQQLDYILINKNLAEYLTQARFVHLNSIQDQSKQYSDHDPLISEFDSQLFNY